MQLGSAFVHPFDIFLLRHNYVIYLFDQITFFDDVRITLYFNMLELRIEITLQLFTFCSSLWRIFITLQLRYLFVRCSYVWITFGITILQLRYVFARNCDVILLRHKDVVLLRHNYVIYLLDVVKFFDNVSITLYFGTFELRIKITLHLGFVFAPHCDVFFITSQSRYLFVSCSYLFWWR